MALWKRGPIYWTDFSIDGERFRLSLETSDEREAKRFEKEKIKQAMDGHIHSKVVPLSKLLLKDALNPYLADYKPHVMANTWISEKERLHQVQKLIGDTMVRRITPDIIKQYIARRVEAG
jgi:hypothetical protein